MISDCSNCVKVHIVAHEADLHRVDEDDFVNINGCLHQVNGELSNNVVISNKSDSNIELAIRSSIVNFLSGIDTCNFLTCGEDHQYFMVDAIVQNLFLDMTQRRSAGLDFVIWGSCLEVFDEKVYDLNSDAPNQPQVVPVRERKGQMHTFGVNKFFATRAKETINMLHTSLRARANPFKSTTIITFDLECSPSGVGLNSSIQHQTVKAFCSTLKVVILPLGVNNSESTLSGSNKNSLSRTSNLSLPLPPIYSALQKWASSISNRQQQSNGYGIKSDSSSLLNSSIHPPFSHPSLGGNNKSAPFTIAPQFNQSINDPVSLRLVLSGSNLQQNCNNNSSNPNLNKSAGSAINLTASLALSDPLALKLLKPLLSPYTTVANEFPSSVSSLPTCIIQILAVLSSISSTKGEDDASGNDQADGQHLKQISNQKRDLSLRQQLSVWAMSFQQIALGSPTRRVIPYLKSFVSKEKKKLEDLKDRAIQIESNLHDIDENDSHEKPFDNFNNIKHESISLLSEKREQLEDELSACLMEISKRTQTMQAAILGPENPSLFAILDQSEHAEANNDHASLTDPINEIESMEIVLAQQQIILPLPLSLDNALLDLIQAFSTSDVISSNKDNQFKETTHRKDPNGITETNSVTSRLRMLQAHPENSYQLRSEFNETGLSKLVKRKVLALRNEIVKELGAPSSTIIADRQNTKKTTLVVDKLNDHHQPSHNSPSPQLSPHGGVNVLNSTFISGNASSITTSAVLLNAAGTDDNALPSIATSKGTKINVDRKGTIPEANLKHNNDNNALNSVLTPNFNLEGMNTPHWPLKALNDVFDFMSSSLQSHSLKGLTTTNENNNSLCGLRESDVKSNDTKDKNDQMTSEVMISAVQEALSKALSSQSELKVDNTTSLFNEVNSTRNELSSNKVDNKSEIKGILKAPTNNMDNASLFTSTLVSNLIEKLLLVQNELNHGSQNSNPSASFKHQIEQNIPPITGVEMNNDNFSNVASGASLLKSKHSLLNNSDELLNSETTDHLDNFEAHTHSDLKHDPRSSNFTTSIEGDSFNKKKGQLLSSTSFNNHKGNIFNRSTQQQHEPSTGYVTLENTKTQPKEEEEDKIMIDDDMVGYDDDVQDCCAEILVTVRTPKSSGNGARTLTTSIPSRHQLNNNNQKFRPTIDVSVVSSDNHKTQMAKVGSPAVALVRSLTSASTSRGQHHPKSVPDLSPRLLPQESPVNGSKLGLPVSRALENSEVNLHFPSAYYKNSNLQAGTLNKAKLSISNSRSGPATIHPFVTTVNLNSNMYSPLVPTIHPSNVRIRPLQPASSTTTPPARLIDANFPSDLFKASPPRIIPIRPQSKNIQNIVSATSRPDTSAILRENSLKFDENGGDIGIYSKEVTALSPKEIAAQRMMKQFESTITSNPVGSSPPHLYEQLTATEKTNNLVPNKSTVIKPVSTNASQHSLSHLQSNIEITVDSRFPKNPSFYDNSSVQLKQFPVSTSQITNKIDIKPQINQNENLLMTVNSNGELKSSRGIPTHSLPNLF